MSVRPPGGPGSHLMLPRCLSLQPTMTARIAKCHTSHIQSEPGRPPQDAYYIWAMRRYCSSTGLPPLTHLPANKSAGQRAGRAPPRTPPAPRRVAGWYLFSASCQICLCRYGPSSWLLARTACGSRRRLGDAAYMYALHCWAELRGCMAIRPNC